jgi:hypothetical protein
MWLERADADDDAAFGELELGAAVEGELTARIEPAG